MVRGDYAVGSTVGGSFRTSTNRVGTTLSGAPNINVYKRGSSTPSTAGRTLNVDVNSITGLNTWVIDTSSDGAFYVAGDFDVTISAGTVNSVSVIGEVVGGFSLASGAAFGRLGAPVGASISADIAEIEGETDDIAAIKAKTDNLPAAPASTTNITAGTITTVTNLTNAPISGDLTATMKTSVQTAADAAITANALVLEIEAETDDIAAVKAKTDNLPAAPASTTNITAGIITTVTNLTNAPTAGDLTATMKTSVQTAADTAITANALVLEIEAETDGIAAIPTSNPSAASIATAVWASVMEGSYSALNYMRIFASALAGKGSGLATTTVKYRDTGDTKDRITATVDADGDRSAITLDGS